MPNPSKYLNKLPPYLFVEIDKNIEKAKAKGVDVISLGVGDPDLPTPAPVVKAMQDAVADPATHNYPPYAGTADFRAAAAKWMKDRFGVEVDPAAETMSLIGSKEGLAHMIAAYIDEGDLVISPEPAYPVYNNFTTVSGGEVHIAPLLAENGFLPDLAAIPEDVAKRAKLFFLNYPNNPTGGILTRDFMEECVAFCKKYDILLCHDNAYSEMTFGDYKAPSFLEIPGAKDVCVEFFSLSKMYNMTGWRVGFAVGNAEGIAALGKIKNNVDSGVFKAVQRAAQVALEKSDELTAGLNDIYGARRELVLDGLRRLGWDVAPPAATFYLWLPVPTGWTSGDFAAKVLEECGVIVTPGLGYGAAGEGFFRMALTVSEARLQEVLARFEDKGITWDKLAKSSEAA